MSLTYSEEFDAWLAERRTKEATIERAAQLWSDPKTGETKRRTSPAWTHDVTLTEAEWRLLWRRFQPVGTPVFGFARRLQCSTPDVMTLSNEQRCWVLALAYKYRRKVFFNPRASELTEAAFVHGIRQLAAREMVAA